MDFTNNTAKQATVNLRWDDEIFGTRYLIVNERSEQDQKNNFGFNFGNPQDWWQSIKEKVKSLLTSAKLQ